MVKIRHVGRGVYEVELEPRTSLTETLVQAIQVARVLGCRIQVKIGDWKVRVEGDSDLSLIARDFDRCRFGAIKGPIGPHPRRELSRRQLRHFDDCRKNWYAHRESLDDMWI